MNKAELIEVLTAELDTDRGNASRAVEAVVDAGLQLLRASGVAISATDQAKVKFLQAGIWGRLADWQTPVRAGDRVELYRALQVDPKVARRQRFKRQGKGRTGLFANRKRGPAAEY